MVFSNEFEERWVNNDPQLNTLGVTMPTSNFKIFVKLKLCFILFSTIIFINCSSADEDSGTTYNYFGPGSEWAISMDTDDSTFTVTESTSDLTVNGTFSTLESGFRLLTVSSASGTDAPSAGDQAFAIDIPGYVFLLKPLGQDSEIISMVSSGSCPVEDFEVNWMITSTDSGATFLDDCSTPTQNIDAVGTFSYTHSSTSGLLPIKYDVCGNEHGDPNYNVGTISCSGGKSSVSTDENISMYLTQSGGMVVNFDETESDNNKIIVAFPNSELSSLSTLDGDYIGFVVADDDVSSSSFVVTMEATVDSNTNTIRFDEISPTSNDVIDSNNANGDFTISGGVNSPANGFFKGEYELDSDASPHKIICIANDNIYSTGKDAIFCVGENPGDADHMFNLILVSKN